MRQNQSAMVSEVEAMVVKSTFIESGLEVFNPRWVCVCVCR